MGTLYHLDVGCADASLIQTPTATFLIDCHDIDRYSHLLPANKKVRGVFTRIFNLMYELQTIQRPSASLLIGASPTFANLKR